MSSVDRRVVEMEFDNRQFERGVRETLESLEALKKGLSLGDAAKGLQDIEGAGKQFNLDGMAAGVENISSKFSALGAIGFTVIQELTRAAMNYGRKLTGMVLDPLVSGGRQRALNIEQARFQFQGLGMDIEATMDSALQAVTGTAYGLDEAAKVAGQLGASGMRAGDDMTSSLRAISGVAAMTSSSYEDIGNIFTKVAGNGRVMGDDLLRMSSRGLNAAATLADHLGISEQEVRQLVTEGQISFEMFYTAMDEAFGENATKANETYTGSLANMRAAMSRIGASFFGPYLEQQRDLFNTLSDAIDEVGEALEPVIDLMLSATGGGTERLIDRINSIDFSKLNLVIDPALGIITNIFEALGSVLRPVRDAFRQIFPPATIEQVGGILSAIERFTESIKMGDESMENLRRTFAGVFAVLGIGWEVVKAGAVFFGDLFGIVFEGSTGFLDATANVGDFLVALHEAVKNGEGLTKFFSGLTELLRGPIEFIKALASAFLGIFDFEAADSDKISDALSRFNPFKVVGEVLLGIWNAVLDVLRDVWDFFRPIADAFGDFFGDLGEAIMLSFQDLDFDRVIKVLQTGLLGNIVLTFRRFGKNLGAGFGSGIHRLTAPFGQMTYTLKKMQATLKAMTLMQIAVSIGILAASVLALSKVDAAGLAKAMAAISTMMLQLVGALYGLHMVGGARGMISASVGLTIFAVALRILASSVRAMSGLDWEELVRGLSGVVALIGSLVASVKLMSGHTAGMFKAGAGLLILSFGIKVLASSVTDLANLSWEDMARGLIGVGALLGALTLFTQFAAANKGAVAQGLSLILLATGIKILASAVGDFGGMSWGEIGKGLAAVAGILVAFAGFSHIISPSALLRTGVSLVLVGSAMNLLASAILDFATLSWGEIARGLASMTGALLAIVLTMNLMPPSTMASAAALVMVSFALGRIGEAIMNMGGMSWGEIARGLVTLAGSLLIIAAALIVMQGTLGGSAALFVAASALRMLAPVLVALGNMSLGEMARSIGMLAAVFVVLGVAGLALGPLTPVLLGLSGAVALLGVGMLAAGAGLFLFSAGLTALAVAGAAGTAAIVAMVAGLAGLIPMVAEQLGLGLIVFAEVVATAGPAMMEAMSAVLGAIIGALQENVPKVIDLIADLVSQLLQKLKELVPEAAQAALEMMLGILRAMNDNVPSIVREIAILITAILQEMADGLPGIIKAATNLMVAFLDGIADNLKDVIEAGANIIISVIEGIGENTLRILEAGVDTILTFIEGLADGIRANSERVGEAGADIGLAIIEGMGGAIRAGAGRIAEEARGVARGALESAKGFLGVGSPSKEFQKVGNWSTEGMAIGIKESAPLVNRSVEDVGKESLDTMKKSMSEMSDILAMDADMNPTITPVLDLDEFRKDASLINSSLEGRAIDIDLAYSKAKNASIGYRSNEEALKVKDISKDDQPSPAITYNQYNQSPKALSSAEIYRQTKNQLSVTKGALRPNAS